MGADAGYADPTSPEGVRRVVAGILRMDRRAQRQADALTKECFAAVQATAAIPRAQASGRRESGAQARTRGQGDVALISVMRDGMLRRSEAATVTWRDVGRAEDGSGRLTIPRSKTDQTGEGSILYLN